jgi:hypothetical protein
MVASYLIRDILSKRQGSLSNTTAPHMKFLAFVCTTPFVVARALRPDPFAIRPERRAERHASRCPSLRGAT